MLNPSEIWGLLKETYAEWQEDKVARLGAALAYYAIFSMAPLLVIVVGIIGLFYHGDTVGYIQAEIASLVGQDAAVLIAQAIDATNDSFGGGVITTLIGLGTLLFGATGVFTQLQDAMNTIWEVTPKPDQGIKGMIQTRFLSFTMVLGVGFLLLISLVINAVISAMGTYFTHLLPGAEPLWQVVNLAVSFGVITLLFAMMYKILPDVEIAWKDVWVGAAFTALLFVIGKFLIGFYIGRSSIGSAYGAAGTLLVVLVWVYYSAQILFFGAEFTQVYANKYGSDVVPSEHALPLSEEARIKQGMPRAAHVEAIAKGKPSPVLPRAKKQPPPARVHVPLTQAESQKSITPGSALVGVAGLLVGFVVGNLRGAARRFR